MSIKVAASSIISEPQGDMTLRDQLDFNKDIITGTLIEAPASFFAVSGDLITRRGDAAKFSQNKLFVRIERKTGEDGNSTYVATIPESSQLKGIPTPIQNAIDSLNGVVKSEH